MDGKNKKVEHRISLLEVLWRKQQLLRAEWVAGLLCFLHLAVQINGSHTFHVKIKLTLQPFLDPTISWVYKTISDCIKLKWVPGLNFWDNQYRKHRISLDWYWCWIKKEKNSKVCTFCIRCLIGNILEVNLCYKRVRKQDFQQITGRLNGGQQSFSFCYFRL